MLEKKALGGLGQPSGQREPGRDFMAMCVVLWWTAGVYSGVWLGEGEAEILWGVCEGKARAPWLGIYISGGSASGGGSHQDALGMIGSAEIPSSDRART